MGSWYVGRNGEGAWADFNRDGIIDSWDLGPFKVCYLKNTQDHPECEQFDLDHNGQVGITDFSKFSGIVRTGRDPVTGVQLQPVVETPKPRAGWLVPIVALGGLVALAVVSQKR